MTPKQFKTRAVSRERFKTYLKKAQEFHRASDTALERGDWDAAALNAVHSAISAADALLVYHGGVRSTGESHHDVVGLLGLHVIDDQTGPKTKTLARIMHFKNLAAYEDREVTGAEAREAAKLAGRFLEWAEARLAA